MPRRLLFLIVGLLAFTSAAFGQGVRRDGEITVDIFGTSRPVANATVRVCSAGSTGVPCTPLASIYSDVGLTMPLANPIKTDASGNYHFYSLAGPYDIQVSGNQVTTYTQTNVPVPCIPMATGCSGGGGGGGGTVTSVSGLSPLFSVASPTTTPTFSLLTAAAYNVFGNCAGATAVPSYCPINSSMLPFNVSIASNQIAYGAGTNAIGGSSNFLLYPNGVSGSTDPQVQITHNHIGDPAPKGMFMVTGGGVAGYNAFAQPVLISSVVDDEFGNSLNEEWCNSFAGSNYCGSVSVANSGVFGISSRYGGITIDPVNGISLSTLGGISPSTQTLIQGFKFNSAVGGGITFPGTTSGTALIGVAAVAGAPCGFILPTTSPSAGYVLSSAAPTGSPATCQTSWVAPSVSSVTLQTNTVNNSSQATLNLLSSSAFNGLTSTVTNTSGGNVQLGLSGTLNNSGLTNSSITIAGTLVSLGGSTSSFPSPGAIGGSTPGAGTFTSLIANTSFSINGGTTQTGIQGTDTKLLTAGTISGTAATLCTDANGGATTSGCSSGSGVTLQTNTVNNSSQTTLNLLNSAAFNGLTGTFTNTSAGNVQLGFSGTLGNAGLTNSAITIAGTSVSLGSSTSSFPSPGAIGGTTPAAGTFTTLKANTSLVINGGTAQTGTQGTDTKLLTAGTVSGTAASLCTDANGGATTSGCTAGSGGVSNQAANAISSNTSGTSTLVDSTVCTPPSTNGVYTVGYSVTASAAVAPACPQAGIASGSISGSTSTYTVGGSTVDDAIGFPIVHDIAGSSAVAVTLPTPTTLANANAVVIYENRSTHTDTITPTTWTIQSNVTAAASSLSVPSATRVVITVDPHNSTNWLASTFSLTAGSGTVTSIATTSPITGGTITTSGTIACATCATTTSGGAISFDKSATGLINPTADATFTYVAGSSSGLTLAGTAPASVSASTGTNASSIFNVTTPTGGAISNATGTAGVGGSPSWTFGNGGAGTGTNAVGGAGGGPTITTGNGGASNGTGANSNGGNLTIALGTAGTGGSGTAGKNGAVAITGATAGFNYCTQGSAVTTANTVIPANSIVSYCPTSVTAGQVAVPGALANGIVTNNLSGTIDTQGVSGDANHSATVTTGSGTSIGSTTLCSSANCPAGTYVVHVYIDVTTACGTTGTYVVNLIYTDDQGSKTAVVNINGTGAVPATGVLTTTSTANFGENSQVIRLTSGNLNYSTTATACGTAGPMVGKLYMAAVPVQ